MRKFEIEIKQPLTDNEYSLLIESIRLAIEDHHIDYDNDVVNTDLTEEYLDEVETQEWIDKG